MRQRHDAVDRVPNARARDDERARPTANFEHETESKR
jgi:hypothetical protein